LRRALRDDLAAVRRHWGIPALMITHDVDDVLALADVALVYDEGRVARTVDLRQVAAEGSSDASYLAITGEPRPQRSAAQAALAREITEAPSLRRA